MARKNELPDIVQSAQSRTRRTIANWRSALIQAESIERPRRGALLSIYKEIMDDAHLTSELQKRLLLLQSGDFYLKDSSGENNEDLNQFFQKKWFSNYVQYAFESRLYGHSLIQLKETDGAFSHVELVNRRHVRPEQGLFVVKESDEKGILYRDDPKTWNWLVEIGDPRDLGILNKCVPHVLIKRFAHSAWSEFSEIFGMPLRVGKTNTKDGVSLDRLETALKDMATAAYMIIDDNEAVEWIESQKTDGKLYENLLNFCNSEISKLISGAVIGEYSQGGSRSKEEVGLEILKLINDADEKFIAGDVNEQLIPKIAELGIAINDHSFKYEKAKDLAALWKMVSEANQHYHVPAQWVQETFGFPLEEKKTLPSVPFNNHSSSFFD